MKMSVNLVCTIYANNILKKSNDNDDDDSHTDGLTSSN